MSDTITPPPGFTLAPPVDDAPTPPSGFTLARPSSHPQGDAASEALYRDLTPQPRGPRTTGEDIQQGVAHGLVSGSASILGLPGDVWNMLKDEHKTALTWGAEKAGLITPETGEAIRQSTIGTAPGSDYITKHVEQLARSSGRDTSPSETRAGQYAQSLASFLPMAAAIPFTGGASAGEALSQVPGAIARYGVLPALTSEFAGQATKGTALEPYARVLGAVAPEGALQGMSAAGRAFTPTGRAIDDMTSLKGLSDEQVANAQRILNESREALAPNTVSEAIQKATGNATQLGNLQRVVEQSPKGGEIMAPFMAKRPAQVDALGRSTFDQIAPTGMDPYEIAPRVQRAAQQVLDTSPQAQSLGRSVDALGPNVTAEEAGNTIRPELQTIYDRREGMRNALANEDYGAAQAADYTADGAPANPVQVRPVIDQIDDQLASAKGATAAALRRARATLFSGGEPDMTVQGLNNARQAIASQVSMAARAGNSDVVRVLGPNGVLGQLDSALEEVPAYGQARRNFARASEPLTPFAENTAPGRIIDQDQFGRNYTMPTDRVAPTIERGGPAAADQFLTAAENSPRAREAFGQYYSRQLLGSATNARGVIDADVLANTLRDNQDMLRRFPEIESNLNRVGVARRAMQQLEQTPVGALAQSTGKTAAEQFAAQQRLLFNPTASLAGGENTVGRTVAAIAAHDPEAAQQFVRQHLEQAFNEATQSNIPGANQFGGAKFAAVVSGNSQQAKNLEVAVRALPDGDLRWTALRKGLDIMEGMGTRQPVGSQTAFNTQINRWLEQGNPAGEFLVQAASPGRWPSLVDGIYRHVMFNRNTAELARVFTEGSVDDLRRMARAGSRSFEGQAAMIGALARQGASQPSQTTP